MLNGKIKIKLSGKRGYLQLTGIYYSADFSGSQGILLESMLLHLKAFYDAVFFDIQKKHIEDNILIRQESIKNDVNLCFCR